MRKQQSLIPGAKQVKMTTQFPGYNHTEIIADGEMFDTKNLSGDGFPVVQQRKRRGICAFPAVEKLGGIYNLDGLVYTKGTKVYYKNTEVEGIAVSTADEMLPKQIVGFGSYVCIWPDKVYFNTIDKKDCGLMERNWSSENRTVQPYVIMCRGDGTDYDSTEITVGDTAPADPANGALWLDTRGDADVLRQYSTPMSSWVEVATTFVKIYGEDIGKGIEQYDTVTIKNLRASEYTGNKNKKRLQELNGDNIVYDCGEDYIVVAGLIRNTVNVNKMLQVNRSVPDMDYLCVSKNRIWGCKYGRQKKAGYRWEKQGGQNISITMSYIAMNTQQEVPAANILNAIVSEEEPPIEEVEENRYWVRTENNETVSINYAPVVLEDYAQWRQIYGIMTISATGIGSNFAEGDEINISGFEPWTDGLSDHAIADQLALNGKFMIREVDKNSLSIFAIDGSPITGRKAGTSSSRIIIEKIADSSKVFVNEIRACKLGDFKNWNNFMGLSTDSYVISVGTEGAFTGAVVQNEYPIFFKENSIMKIMGNTPSSFQLQTVNSRGVQNGSWRSVAVVNEVVYYKSVHEVMALTSDGRLPSPVSDQLGGVWYEDARAGAVNGKYYISMKTNGEWNHFVYDTKRRIWYREDDLQVMEYATVQDALFAIDEANNALVGINGDMATSGGVLEDEPEWYAVFGISGVEFAPGANGGYSRSELRGSLYLSRFDIRMYVEDGTKLDMYIMYDSDGEWLKQGTIENHGFKTFTLPVIPRRCDHLRVKLCGRGAFRIYNISRMMEAGGDG